MGTNNMDEALRKVRETQNELFDWWDFDSAPNGRSNADITISRVKPAAHSKKEDMGKYRYSITFRNKTDEKFGDYIDMTVMKNRVIFRPGMATRSRKFYGANHKNRNVIVVENEKTKVLKDFIGDYALRYDENFEVYYVEK